MKLSLPITVGCLLLATAFLGAQDYRRATMLSHRGEPPRNGADSGGAAPQRFNPLNDEDRARPARKMAKALLPELGAVLPI
jgi:hypothetical protein